MRKKWKEFLAFYATEQRWPYDEIKNVLSLHDQTYFQTFCQTIEKSISNPENLLLYRQLLKDLREWRKKAKGQT